jgi:hydroxymethylpyrimidine/phosphomethylpyrimidine kinase
VAETTHRSRGPLIVAVGGLDSSGGAGLIRDYFTGRDLGVQVCLIGTAWTVQAETGVLAIDSRDPDRLRHDLATALAAARGRAAGVKLGLIAAEPQVGALLDALRCFSGPVVFDPVLAASRGGKLHEGDPRSLLPLIRRSILVTPNLREAGALTGQAVATVEDARRAASDLVLDGARAVLVKGGHLASRADDLLIYRQEPDREHDQDPGQCVERIFTAPRLPGPSPRGTGCALATAIAVGLARGQALEQAISEAKMWLHDRIARAGEVGGERHL